MTATFFPYLGSKFLSNDRAGLTIGTENILVPGRQARMIHLEKRGNIMGDFLVEKAGLLLRGEGLLIPPVRLLD